MVRELANEYCKLHPEIKIDVSGGGSGIGFKALIQKQTEIANASREIKSHELTEAGKNGVDPLPVMFSVDALAIVTHSKLGIDSLSTRQLQQIFSGHITNWKELGGPDLVIHLYGRDSTSGTYAYFQDKFVTGGYAADMQHLKGNADIVNAVKQDLGGIGYTGVGYLMDHNGKPTGDVWAMPIYNEGSLAYSPYEISAVKHGDYVLTRPLYQYMNGKPSTKIYDFILFELTAKGQEVIRKFGYFPINDCQKEINHLNGLYY